LLHDLSVKPIPKVLFAIYHSCCREKRLGQYPFTFISQKRIGREYLGRSQQTVSRGTIELEEAGWCTIIRIGQGRSNIIVLHDRKGKRLTAQEKKNFIKLVRLQQARYHQMST